MDNGILERNAPAGDPATRSSEARRSPIGRVPVWFRWVVGIVLVLIGIRIALPYALTWEMNRVLADSKSYPGRVEAISLSLWRGAYQVDGLDIRVKRRDAKPTPFLAVDRIDIAIDWNALFHGRIVSSLKLDRPRLVIAPSGPDHDEVKLPTAEDKPKDPAEAKKDEAKPVGERWQDRVSSVIAFRVDELRIEHGNVQYLDVHRDVDLSLGDFHGTLRNLTGGRETKQTPALITIDGVTSGGGLLHVEGKVEPWATVPTFDIRAAIENVHLFEFNPSAKHLNGLTFRKGVFSAYAEAQAKDGNIEGYIKPLFIDLDIASYGLDTDSAAKKLFWKAAIVVAENLLPNDDTEALAARIPIKGHFDDPKTDAWTVIGSVLGNAFLSAILPGFEGMTSFTSTK